MRTTSMLFVTGAVSLPLSLPSGAADPPPPEVETFDGGVFTNPFFAHDFDFNDPCCREIVFRNDLDSWALHLRPNSDLITFALPSTRRVRAVGVRILDFEGGFVGTAPTSVGIVRAASGDFVALRASALGSAEFVRADVDTPGQLTGEPLGEIVSVRLDAANEGNALFPTEIGAYFDDITVELDSTADVNGDGVVNVLDLLAVLGAWGPCPPPPGSCVADANGDGLVNVLDVLVVLAEWG